MKLAETAYAKINLALHVRGRREDGYHEIETLFAFAEDGDLLSVAQADQLSLTITGPFGTGPFGTGLSAGPDNLVLRAAEMLRTLSGIRAGAALHLDKRLPIAAGIGGGSADAAAALRLLMRFWGITLPDGALRTLAAALGADVPACVGSKLCFGAGVGESLTPVADPILTGRPILLVNPRRPCPTGPVFAGWDRRDRGALDLAAWAGARNDLTEAAIALVPEIAKVLHRLDGVEDAQLVRMSGSGATCFALFDSVAARDAAEAACDPDWWTLATRLRG
jgi:4-diphosphocytidyl-2-C-methyl-D-erythritol kinase